MTPDPRAFYNDRMPDKHGEDYEYARQTMVMPLRFAGQTP